METITLTKLNCRNCKNSWFPRLIDRKPKECPKCKIQDFETPKRPYHKKTKIVQKETRKEEPQEIIRRPTKKINWEVWQ